GGYGPIYAESDRIWVAPAVGGLYWLQNDRLHPVTAAGVGKDIVYSISGGGGDVWIGQQHGGLTRLRVKGDDVSGETFSQAQGLSQNNVYAVERSRDGSVWAGTLSGGLSLFRNGTFKTFTTADGLASNTVSAIVQGADGTMWFATPNGLSARSNDTWRRYAV